MGLRERALEYLRSRNPETFVLYRRTLELSKRPEWIRNGSFWRVLLSYISEEKVRLEIASLLLTPSSVGRGILAGISYLSYAFFQKESGDNGKETLELLEVLIDVCGDIKEKNEKMFSSAKKLFKTLLYPKLRSLSMVDGEINVLFERAYYIFNGEEEKDQEKGKKE